MNWRKGRDEDNKCAVYPVRPTSGVTPSSTSMAVDGWRFTGVANSPMERLQHGESRDSPVISTLRFPVLGLFYVHRQKQSAIDALAGAVLVAETPADTANFARFFRPNWPAFGR